MGQALYHDGACTCATLAKLTQKVGLSGRVIFESHILSEIYALSNLGNAKVSVLKMSDFSILGGAAATNLNIFVPKQFVTVRVRKVVFI